MSEQQPEAPGPVEHGRYAVFETPDGGLVIARSPFCETCGTCACAGTVPDPDPISIPAMAVKAWQAMRNGNGKGALGMAREMMKRG